MRWPMSFFPESSTRIRIRKAITLVELSLVLAVAAITVFVALRAYSQASENEKIEVLTSEISMIQGAVVSLASNFGNYAGFDGNALVHSIPDNFFNGTYFSQPFGNMWEFADTMFFPGDRYDISVNSLTQDACIRLGAMDMGLPNTRIAINEAAFATPIGGTIGSALPIVGETHQAYAASKCVDGLNAITWQFD